MAILAISWNQESNLNGQTHSWNRRFKLEDEIFEKCMWRIPFLWLLKVDNLQLTKKRFQKLEFGSDFQLSSPIFEKFKFTPILQNILHGWLWN